MSQWQDAVSPTQKIKELPRNTREFVRLGYNDACINFLVQFNKYDFDILEQCIKDVKEYNDYRGSKVAKAFASIKDLLYAASFGREGSPVLYMRLHPSEWNSETEQWIPKTSYKLQGEVQQLKNAFKNCAVDEVMTMDEARNESSITLRLWWD